MIEFMLPFPPSVNGLYVNVRGRGRVKSRRYSEWILHANKAAHGQDVQANPYQPAFTGPVEITYIFGRPDKRVRDVESGIKAVSDFLTSYGILKDDSQIYKLTAEWGEGNGVFITVKEYVAKVI